MDHPSLDTVLSPSRLTSVTYTKLISLLTENEAWRKVAEAFGIFSAQDVQYFGRTRAPAETLIHELETRLCSVEILCEVLQDCSLYNIVTLFKEYEPLCILEQPGMANDSKMVVRGGQLRLTCRATGVPIPNYQWYCDNRELDTNGDSTLCVNNFRLEHEGEYYCIISQEGYESLTSNYVSVLLAPEKPVIVRQPVVSVACNVGSKVELNVVAKGHPALKYQWYCGNVQLNGSTEPKLVIPIKEESQDGTYRCYVYNSAGEVWSNESKIRIYTSPRPEPTAKVALLIANQLYDNLDCLNTPQNDVMILTLLLQDLGFSTIALQNLNLVEMRNAVNYLSKILPKDAYVVFYFSGHGFEMYDKFMLPIDAPGPEDYLQTHALCERELLRTVLGSRPRLFLELLDMCLKPPDPVNKKIFDEKTNLYEYEASNNLIQGYATTSYLGAYETKSDANGLYVEHLKHHLVKTKDLPIVEILRNVAKDVAKTCPLQKPFFGTNVTMDYRLTDKCRDVYKIREKIDALSVTPDDFVLAFKQVKVNSNVSFNPYLGVFLNTVEVCFSNLQDFKNIIIKIKNIQKLVSSKTLTLWLSGKSGQLMDYAVWDLGKPLIAVADLWWKASQEQSNE